MGDMNCKLDKKSSGREAKIKSMMDRLDIVSLHNVDNPLPTYFPSNDREPCMLDYILVQKEVRSDFTDLRVDNRHDFHSDHGLIRSSFRPAFTKALIRQKEEEDSSQLEVQTTNFRIEQPWNIAKLKQVTGREDDDKETYADLIVEEFQRLEKPEIVRENSVEENYVEFKKAMTDVFTRVIGRTRPSRNGSKRMVPDWVNEQVAKALKAKKLAYRAISHTEYGSKKWAASIQKWREAKNQLRKAVFTAKEEHWAALRDEIKTCRKEDARKLWKMVRKAIGGSPAPGWGAVPVDGKLVVPEDPKYAEHWANYYAVLGQQNENPDLDSDTQLEREEIRKQVLGDSMWMDSDNEFNEPFSTEEIIAAQSKIKAGKAVGSDGIAPEMLKLLDPEWLRNLFNDIWDKETPPEEWNISVTVPLRKDEVEEMSHSRGISLVQCISKLFELCLLSRIEKFVDENHTINREQGGFRPGRECVEQTFSITQHVKQRRGNGKKTYLIFIDLRKAYDLVWRDGLWKGLFDKGIKGKMLRMLKSMYDRTLMAVKVAGKVSNPFSIQKGVKQGASLSPMLFDLFIDSLFDEMKDKGLGIETEAGLLPGFLFADDIVLAMESIEKVHEALDVVTQWCNRMGMEIGASKCAVMVVASKVEEEQEKARTECRQQVFQIQNQTIRVATEYKYLGVIIQDNLNWEKEMEERVLRVKESVNALIPFLWKKSLPRDLRLETFKAIVIPKAMYGSELWGVNERAFDKLESEVVVGLNVVLFGSRGFNASKLMVFREAGLLPLFALGAKSRMRLTEKWMSDSDRHYWANASLSLKWPRTEGWSWSRIIAGLKSKFDVSSSNDMNDQHIASKYWMDKLLEKSRLSNSKLRYAEIVKNENFSKTLCGDNRRGVEVLSMLRVGSLPTMDRVSKIPLPTQSTSIHGGVDGGGYGGGRLRQQHAQQGRKGQEGCPLCGEQESWQHFVFECSELQHLRQPWFDEWHIRSRSDFSEKSVIMGGHSPEMAVLLANPKFSEVDEQVINRLLNHRIAALGGMWTLRCRALKNHKHC